MTNDRFLATILILNFFATDLHGFLRIFTDGYSLFCFIVNLLNSSALIRGFSVFITSMWLKLVVMIKV